MIIGAPIRWLGTRAIHNVGAALCAMLLAMWASEGRLEIVLLAIFAAVAGATVWLGIRVYRRFIRTSFTTL